MDWSYGYIANGQYRIGLNLTIGSQTGDAAVVKGWGGAQLYNYTGHMNSAIIMPKVGTDYSYSGNIYALNYQNNAWLHTNQWWTGDNKYTVGTISKTHSAQTKKFTAKLNIGGAGVISITDSITIPAKDHYSVVFNAPTSATPVTKWYNEALKITQTAVKASTTSTYTVTLKNKNGTADTVKTQTNTTNYSFKNWNTASNGTGTAYALNSTYTQNKGVNLYAQFTSSVVKGSVTLPKPSTAPANKVFKGWSTSDGGAVVYQANKAYTFNGNTTLYAVWGAAVLSHLLVINAANRATVPTWEELVVHQSEPSNVLYNVGGRESRWSVAYVSNGTKRLYYENRMVYEGSGQGTYVDPEERPQRGATYHV